MEPGTRGEGDGKNEAAAGRTRTEEGGGRAAAEVRERGGIEASSVK
jgi:hypothetical protein